METIKLQKPITHQQHTHDTLKLREPVARDLLLMEKQASGEMERALWLIAQLAEVPVEVIHEMSVPDLAQAQAHIAPFFEAFGGTRAT